MVITTAIDPGPLKLGMARGLNERFGFFRASLASICDVALPWEEHSIAKNAYHHSTGQANTRNRDSKGYHNEMAREDKAIRIAVIYTHAKAT